MKAFLPATTTLALFVALCLAAGPALSQPSQEPGWSVRLAATSILGTTGGTSDATLGYGLGIEYRISRRLGVELKVATSEVRNEVEVGFFDFPSFTVRSEVRATPILAQLDVHLTPDRRVDVYLGPVIGYVRYGDLETTIRGLDGGAVPVVKTSVDDGFAWGAHLGLDAPFGSSGAFFTSSLSYLQAEVETPFFGEDIQGFGFDLDPLVIQAGIGYRF